MANTFDENGLFYNREFEDYIALNAAEVRELLEVLVTQDGSDPALRDFMVRAHSHTMDSLALMQTVKDYLARRKGG